MTAGTIFRSNQVCLGQPILEMRREKENEIMKMINEGIKKMCKKYKTQMAKYAHIIDCGYLTKAKPSVADTKIWIQVRKNKTDRPIATKKKK